MQWPGWLRNIYLAIILFIILTWLELGFEVTSSPLATAVLAIIMTFLVMVPSLMFEKMSFCQYGCLIGRVCGLYSMISPVEIRAESKSVCAGCKTRDCYKGNEKGYPCPTSQCLVNMDRNTYCNVCTECIKTCPNNNVSFNIRSFAADLLKPIRPRKDEAFMALVMVSLTSFHGMTMTGIWTYSKHLRD
jgi:polyferredoxin